LMQSILDESQTRLALIVMKESEQSSRKTSPWLPSNYSPNFLIDSAALAVSNMGVQRWHRSTERSRGAASFDIASHTQLELAEPSSYRCACADRTPRCSYWVFTLAPAANEACISAPQFTSCCSISNHRLCGYRALTTRRFGAGFWAGLTKGAVVTSTATGM